MMASNLLSRLLPSASDEPYETHPSSRAERRPSSSSDEHHAMDIDEENLEARFEAQDLEHLLADASSSQMTAESTAFLPQHNERAPPGINTAKAGPWRQPPAARIPAPDDDDDVPQSLLLEGGRDAPISSRQARVDGLPPPVPGPSTRQARAQWEATRRQQRLHDDGQNTGPARAWGHAPRPGQSTTDPRERALWLWVNVTDLDTFLAELYDYYIGCGIWSIILRRVLMLLQTAFVVGFLGFLNWCIDYSKISQNHKLSEVLVPKCFARYVCFPSSVLVLTSP